MTQLLAGLVGVILGAVVSEGLRARNERLRRIRSQIGAMRLISEELTMGAVAIEGEDDPDAGYIERRIADGSLSTLEWTRYKPVLAESLDEPDWNIVAEPYVTIQLLTGNVGHLAEKEMAEFARSLPKEVDAAVEKLTELEVDSEHWSLRRRLRNQHDALLGRGVHRDEAPDL